MLVSGCGLFGTHKKVQVPQLLTPLSEANTPQLISEVNRLSAVRSIHGRIDIVFEDTSFAEAGIAEKYRLADGQLRAAADGAVPGGGVRDGRAGGGKGRHDSDRGQGQSQEGRPPHNGWRR